MVLIVLVIDCSWDIERGTPEGIREKVGKAIEDAAQGGGFVLGPDSAIYENAPVENAVAFFKAGREFGKIG